MLNVSQFGAVNYVKFYRQMTFMEHQTQQKQRRFEN